MPRGMCGISGVISGRGDVAPARQRVGAMVRALVHRGPDGDGLWQDAAVPIVLGHNRLAILATWRRLDNRFRAALFLVN